jgi:hypothetical protein
MSFARSRSRKGDIRLFRPFRVGLWENPHPKKSDGPSAGGPIPISASNRKTGVPWRVHLAFSEHRQRESGRRALKKRGVPDVDGGGRQGAERMALRSRDEAGEISNHK